MDAHSLKIGVYELKSVYKLKLIEAFYTRRPKNHVRPFNLLRPSSAKSFSESLFLISLFTPTP